MRLLRFLQKILPMASITISAKGRYPEDLKDKNEEQILEWSKANKEHWSKIKAALGATDTDTLEDLADVAPEDYQDKVHELTSADQLKPMEVTKLFKLVNAVRVSQGLEPVELRPLSAKKLRVSLPEDKGDNPDAAPSPELPPTLLPGQESQVVGNPFIAPFYRRSRRLRQARAEGGPGTRAVRRQQCWGQPVGRLWTTTG